MTSSSDRLGVVRDRVPAEVTTVAMPDLRVGGWTRLGPDAVRGDEVVEGALATLAGRARDAGQAQGYAAGWAHGARQSLAINRLAETERATAAREAERQRDREHRGALAALHESAARLDAATTAVRRRLETQGVELALAVTAEVLGAAAVQHTPAQLVDRLLASLPDRQVATVRLHPAAVTPYVVAALHAAVEVVADDTLGPADALIELAEHVIDLRVDQSLARVREALS